MNGSVNDKWQFWTFVLTALMVAGYFFKPILNGVRTAIRHKSVTQGLKAFRKASAYPFIWMWLTLRQIVTYLPRVLARLAEVEQAIDALHELIMEDSEGTVNLLYNDQLLTSGWAQIYRIEQDADDWVCYLKVTSKYEIRVFRDVSEAHPQDLRLTGPRDLEGRVRVDEYIKQSRYVVLRIRPFRHYQPGIYRDRQ